MKFNRSTATQFKLPEGKREIIVFDEALPGFGLRIRDGGKRTWVVQYRLGQKQRRLSIGSVNKVNFDDAKQLAKKALYKAEIGTDPQVEKAERKLSASLTLSKIVDNYVSSYAEKRLKPNSLVGVKRYLRVHWRGLAQVPAASITRADVAGQLSRIANENGRYASNRARAALSALFAWAIAEGLVETDRKAHV